MFIDILTLPLWAGTRTLQTEVAPGWMAAFEHAMSVRPWSPGTWAFTSVIGAVPLLVTGTWTVMVEPGATDAPGALPAAWPLIPGAPTLNERLPC